MKEVKFNEFATVHIVNNATSLSTIVPADVIYKDYTITLISQDGTATATVKPPVNYN